MDNAKWTGNAGADQWNIGIAHNDVFMFMFGSRPPKQTNETLNSQGAIFNTPV
jgi:hypothetical protein